MAGEEQCVPFLGGGVVRYIPNWIPPHEATDLYEQLMEEVPWRQEHFMMGARKIQQPRLTAWVGEEGMRYVYSRRVFEPSPWSPKLAMVRDRLRERLGITTNSVLCNLYRTGQDSMGCHADDEPELGTNPTIASVSLGETRKMIFRHAAKEAPKVELELEGGSLLVMSGTLQHHWRHELPKTKRPKAPRINLTYRHFLAARS